MLSGNAREARVSATEEICMCYSKALQSLSSRSKGASTFLTTSKGCTYHTSKTFLDLYFLKNYAGVYMCDVKYQNILCLSQTEFRAYQTRKRDAQRRAAVKIQAWFRGCRARRAYTSKQAAIATISRCVQTRFQRSR